jgi:hypothetical protein
MSILEIIFWLLPIAYAAICIRRLRRACEAQRRAKGVWKTYAIALEVAYECESDWDEAQSDRAALAAEIASKTLYEMGEYPDAYGTSPFLPACAPALNP